MAVKVRTMKLKDRLTGRVIDVHYIPVNNSNKKGAAEAIGGFLFQPEESFKPWWIELDTTVNGRKVRKSVHAGDYAFRTGKNARWQIASAKRFNDRFSTIK